MLILVSELCFRLPYCLFKCVILIIYINAFVRQIRHCFFQIFFCSRFQYILYIFILRQFHFRGRFIFSAESIVHHFHTFNCKFSNDLILFLLSVNSFILPIIPIIKSVIVTVTIKIIMIMKFSGKRLQTFWEASYKIIKYVSHRIPYFI